MLREITNIVRAEQVIAAHDMVLWRALPRPERTSLGPFVFVDHYRSTTARGIGDAPHPHAGIEVLSYLLEGGMEHRDSLGNVDRLGPGDAQVMHTGRGLLHAERPFGPRHGLQMWTSLPPDLKQSEPLYRSFPAAAIPQIDEAGARIRVVTGNIGGAIGPAVFARPTVFAHLSVDAGATIDIAVENARELGAYVLLGMAECGGEALRPGLLGVFGQGSSVRLSAGDGAVEMVLLGGDPAEGDILFGGPFVMDTPERLAQARRDFASGRMGRLDGVPR